MEHWRLIQTSKVYATPGSMFFGPGVSVPPKEETVNEHELPKNVFEYLPAKK
jgi:hypothetical protein